jgi:hypothetical protein
VKMDLSRVAAANRGKRTVSKAASPTSVAK